MKKNISKVCGKGNCNFYDKNLSSKCRIYINRRYCQMSIDHRDKMIKKSRAKAKITVRW